jgi:hypothetical protein
MAHKIFSTLRAFGGAIELTRIMGLVIVVFAIPLIQLVNKYTSIDFLTFYLSKGVKRVLSIIGTFFSIISSPGDLVNI